MSAAVTAVICNFNKRDDVLRAVQSVLDSEGVAAEVIVVDNASTDGSAAALRQRFGGRIAVLAMPDNLGGAGGFATGMRAAAEAEGEFVLLLDNDAHLAPDTLAQLTGFLRRRPDAAVVAPVILDDGTSDLVQELGGRINVRFAFEPNFRGTPRTALPAEPFACDYVAACCLLTRRAVIREVGVFDDSYFLYWDDIDWCARVRRLPHGGVFGLPSATAWHRGGGAANPMARYYQWRNRLKFLAAHRERWPAGEFVPSLAEQAMTALVNAHLSGKEMVVASILAALEDVSAGRFGKCAHEGLLAALVAPSAAPPAGQGVGLRRFPHVFDALEQGVGPDEVVEDAYGNRIGPLTTSEALCLARTAPGFARCIAAALASLS